MRDQSDPATGGFSRTARAKSETIFHHSKVVSLVFLVVFMVFAVMTLGPLRSEAFAVSAPAINQCNGLENVGGQAISCTVDVTNNLNLATGVVSSSVSGTSCTGAANAALTCIPWTAPSNQLTIFGYPMQWIGEWRRWNRELHG